MSTGGALRELARFLDACESAEREATVGPVRTQEGRLVADLTIELQASALSVRSAEADGGNVELDVKAADALPAAGAVAVDPRTASFGPHGTVTVELVATVPVDDADHAGADGDVAAAPADADAREVPPFEDPELLARVYEDNDTFAEMVDALGMDVTPETVRRYMIDHGIHQPASRGEDGNGDDEDTDPVVLADGFGLPEGVTAEGLADAVAGAKTPGGVGRRLGIGRQAAVESLRELGLLDLVLGRVATENERAVGREAVLERLREGSR